MHIGDMRGVERVFHEAKGADIPRFIKLMDLAKARQRGFRQFGNAGERLIQRDPDVSVFFTAR